MQGCEVFLFEKQASEQCSTSGQVNQFACEKRQSNMVSGQVNNVDKLTSLDKFNKLLAKKDRVT